LADWKGIGSYGTIGLEMVLSVLFGGFLGNWVDSKLDTAPYGMLVGFGFGVAAAVRALLRAMREMSAETARDGFRASSTDRPARFALEQRELDEDGGGLRTEPEAEDEEQEEPDSGPRGSDHERSR
jgi:hypothetical protein